MENNKHSVGFNGVRENTRAESLGITIGGLKQVLELRALLRIGIFEQWRPFAISK